jgi:hypothetical protein
MQQEPLNGVHQEGGVGLTKGVVKAVIGYEYTMLFLHA